MSHIGARGSDGRDTEESDGERRDFWADAVARFWPKETQFPMSVSRRYFIGVVSVGFGGVGCIRVVGLDVGFVRNGEGFGWGV